MKKLSDIYGKDLITSQDWTIDQLKHTMTLASRFKTLKKRGKVPPRILDRKIFRMLFYSPSTRTRGGFETAMENLGGHASIIDMKNTRVEEDLMDAAKMYELYSDAIGIRVQDETIDFKYGNGRRIVEYFARIAKVPVINMACCTYHPSQAIGDVMTLKEKLGRLKGKKYTIMWGYSSRLKGRCSIQEELLITTRLGMDVVLVYPPEFGIDPKIVKIARINAYRSGGNFEISHNFEKALRNANVVFPRSWISSKLSSLGTSVIGNDEEMKIHNKYKNWRLEQKHVKNLMKKSAIVAHTLPVSRGEEATDDVLNGSHSVIYEQAENGLYAKKAILSLIMAKKVVL
jgi:ornithine carbamoyltransferase